MCIRDRASRVKADGIDTVIDLKHLVSRNVNDLGEIVGEVARKCEVKTHELAVKTPDPLIGDIAAIQVADSSAVLTMNAYRNAGEPCRQLDFECGQVAAVDNGRT